MIKSKSQLLDELLVLQAQRGDKEAFEQLVIKWHKKLIYQSQFRTRNQAQSQDIVQDVWQWLTGNLHRLEDISNFGSWIRTIVDRRSIDWLRKQKVNVELTAHETHATNRNIHTNPIDGDAEDAVEQSLRQLELAMTELTADTKLILALYYTESQSIESIAKIVGIPKGTVKSRLFHAREKLKKLLNK